MAIIRQDLRATGLSNEEIDKCLKVLKHIYIGQNIRDEGILQGDFSSFQHEIDMLLRNNLIKENFWYRHSLYVTTAHGSRAARELVEERIEKYRKDAEGFLRRMPPKLMGFLVHTYFCKKLNYPVSKSHLLCLDWREPLLDDIRIWSYRDRVLSKLESMGLCARTRSYVSTRGGELREENYVISPEIRRFLVELFPGKGLVEEEQRMCQIYHLLNRVRRIFDIADLKRLKERYWDEILRAGISEDEIKKTIDSMAKDGITSSYYGLLSDKPPFQIKEDTPFSIAIRTELIEPVIRTLLEEKPKVPTVVFGRREKDADIVDLVIRLVEAKFDAFRTASFLGVDLFHSTPDTERCITRMLRLPTSEGELAEFVKDLHWFLIDRSRNLLKFGGFREGKITNLEQELKRKGHKIPSIERGRFEKAVEIFYDLDILRNKYVAHTKKAEDWEKIGKIFRKLINKPLPRNKEDLEEAQRTIIEEVTEGLDILSNIWQYLAESNQKPI